MMASKSFFTSDAPSYPGVALNKIDLLKLAKQYFILDDGMSELNLIRRIQHAAGHFDCFATARVWNCSQFECRWRKDCVLKSIESVPADS
jgi:hypothetical protein